jgi:hypothetical protein
MPCACERCVQHSKTLGLTARPPSKAAIRKAYKVVAKLWHPDRFENNPRRRLDAEEQFKRIQVAYRELWEHCEKPEKSPIEETSDVPPRRGPDLPNIFFGDAPGCFVAPHFPWYVAGVVASHLEETERAVAFVDLSAGGMRGTICSRYIFLTSYRIFVRDAMNVVSLLWYNDLGDVLLLDQRERDKNRLWKRIVESVWGIKREYQLQINRHNGTHFYSIAGPLNDNVKRVIYNFLLQMKQQPHP